MASIQIHQDIYNFKKRKKGFEPRQIVCFAAAGLGAFFVLWLCVVVLKLDWMIAGFFAMFPIYGFVLAGFFPIFGMPAEQFAAKLYQHSQRGTVVLNHQETCDIERGGISRVQKKQQKQKGYESLY